MASFKRTLIRMIDRKAYERDYFEEVIAVWLFKKYLTTEEADECLAELDKIFGTKEQEAE